jgi:hypothetical protein
MAAQPSFTASIAAAASIRPFATSCSVLVSRSCASPERGGFLALAKPSVSTGQ